MSAPVEVDQVLAERYRIERHVGSGGMADVYLAHDQKLDRQVAVKILKRDISAVLGSDRFVQEIRITAGMQHPNILPLLDSGLVAGNLFYTMPFVEDATLFEHLRKKGPLSAPEAVAIAIDVAVGLAYAHERGFIHRDIKPENIMLPGGRGMVSDFGIARALEVASGSALSSPGIALGTAAYMSPEQAAGSSRLDARTDLYSLGCVLYEMLAGEPPFTGPTPQAIMARHVAERMPSIAVLRPAIGASVVKIIEKALGKSPADRFSSANEMAEALRESLTDTTPGFVIRDARRRKLRIAGTSVAAVAAFAAVGWLTFRPPPPAALDPAHIAVMYLEDRSDSGTLRHLSAGLTEDLIGELSQVPALHVISPDGVKQFAAGTTPLDSIARRLGVGTIVAGSIVEASGSLRVSIRLVNAATGRQIASQVFEQPRSGILALRDELVADVARSLRIQLGREIELRTRRSGTSSGEAWDIVQRARSIGDAVSSIEGDPAASAMMQADSLLQQAERFDPGWPEPIVQRGWIAYALSGLHMTGSPTVGRSAGRTSDQWLRAALRHAERALALSPDYPEALELRGTTFYRASFLSSSGAFDDLPDALSRAERDLRAAASQPSPIQTRALSTLSNALAIQGKWEEAHQAAYRAYTVDEYFQDGAGIINSLYLTSWELGRAEDSRRWCSRGSRSFPDDWQFRFCRLTNMVAFPQPTDTIAAAWAAVEEVLETAPPGWHGWLGPRLQALAASVIAHRAQGDSAERVIDRARALSPMDPEILLYESFVRITLSQPQQALDRLEQYLRANPTHRRRLWDSFLLRSLRTDRRFQELTAP